MRSTSCCHLLHSPDKKLLNDADIPATLALSSWMIIKAKLFIVIGRHHSVTSSRCFKLSSFRDIRPFKSTSFYDVRRFGLRSYLVFRWNSVSVLLESVLQHIRWSEVQQCVQNLVNQQQVLTIVQHHGSSCPTSMQHENGTLNKLGPYYWSVQLSGL